MAELGHREWRLRRKKEREREGPIRLSLARPSPGAGQRRLLGQGSMAWAAEPFRSRPQERGQQRSMRLSRPGPERMGQRLQEAGRKGVRALLCCPLRTSPLSQ